MASLLGDVLASCLCGGRSKGYEPLRDEKNPTQILTNAMDFIETHVNHESPEALAAHAVYGVMKSISCRLSTKEVRQTSWAADLAYNILERLIALLKTFEEGAPVNDTLKDIYDTARNAALRAFEFAKDHPVFTILLALGILCLIAPWVVHVLGFASEGIVAGSWAARWQSTFGGVIEADSLFAWLQSFGALH